MKTGIVTILTGLCLVMGQAVVADTLGVYAGIGSWNSEYSGDVFLIPADTLDLEGTRGESVYLKIEHPVPVLPNFKVARQDVDDTGQTVVDLGGLFGTVTTETILDLSHTDFTLYYEIIDIGMDIDLGLTARKFDGEFSQRQTSSLTGLLGDSTIPIDGTIPMLYVSANVDLPLTGFYMGVEVNAITYSGDGFKDYLAKIGWKTDSWILPEIGAELGYRNLSITADDKLDVTLDMQTDGYFLSIVAHF